MGKQQQYIPATEIEIKLECYTNCMREFREPQPNSSCSDARGRVLGPPWPSTPEGQACSSWDTRRRRHAQMCRYRCGSVIPSDRREEEFRKSFGSGGSRGLPYE